MIPRSHQKLMTADGNPLIQGITVRMPSGQAGLLRASAPQLAMTDQILW